MQKIIKHRLFTWFETVNSAIDPDAKVRLERINHMGEDVDITDALSLQRGIDLDSFYTDEEADQIREGTYRGPDAEILARFRAGIKPASQIEPIEGEGPQTENLTVEELAEYIEANRLNVADTVALAGDTLESIEKVLDAENIATDNSPRTGVTDALDKKMKAVTS